MPNHDESDFTPEGIGQQLGHDGVESVVGKVEAFCDYERMRIELSNQPRIAALQTEAAFLVRRRIILEEHLAQAPPPSDTGAQRLKAIIGWTVGVLLTISGFVFCVLAFDPFQLGWRAYFYCAGIAVLTPYCVEMLLSKWNSERLVKVLIAISCVLALASLAALAIIRGNIFAHHLKTEDSVVIEQTAQSATLPAEDTFYEDTVPLLRMVMVLLAIAGELAAGLAFHDALRLRANRNTDFTHLHREITQIEVRLPQITFETLSLRNEPAVFAARFWRDFYRAMITNTVRNALTKLLLVTLVLLPIASTPAWGQQQKLAVVVAVDLTASVGQETSDSRTDFQKNLEAVSRLLLSAPTETRITIIGITDQSFSRPLILLSAKVGSDEGYFGEKLTAARRALVKAWQIRSAKLAPEFKKTDVLGALLLADQIFDESPESKKVLILMSDMRHVALGLDLESPDAIETATMIKVADRGRLVANLPDVQVYVAGAVAPGKHPAYWESLRSFWAAYFQKAGASVNRFAVTREIPRLDQMP